jgi:Zn-dependent protease with chaperone function
MNTMLGLPALVGIVAAIAAWVISTRSRPELAVKMLTASFVFTAMGIFTAGALYTVAWMVPAEQALWCRRMLGHSADHRPVSGAIVLSMLVGIVVRAVVVGRRVTSVWKSEAVGRASVAVEQSDEFYAFSVPPTARSAGSVVVSTSMLEALTDDEQSALFAHEHAHLRFGHHRYLLIGRVLEGVVPFVRPLTRRVYWLLERWADEAAAREVGNRETVATAIAHAALSASGHRTRALLGFGSDSVVDRVEALFQPLAPPSRSANLILGLCVAATAAATATQMHHLADLVGHMAA